MKKAYKIIGTSILCILLFSACQGAVFSGIMKDVAEESAEINGNILSIARYQVGGTEFLATSANGGLRYKLANNNSHGSWKTYSSIPFALHQYSYYNASNHTGERLLKVLADDEYIYLVTVKETKDTTLGTSVPETFHIWTKKMTLAADNTWTADDSDWTDITETNKRKDSDENGSENESELLQFYPSGSYYYTNFNVFSTNSVQNAHRKVFIRSGNGSSSTNYKYYEIDGTTVTELTESNVAISSAIKTALEITDERIILDSSATTLASTAIDSAAYLGDTLYFFNAIAVTDNETSTQNSTGIFYGACNISISQNRKTNYDDLYYFDGTINKKLIDAGEPISCFALCNNALIIGRADYSNLSTYSSTGGVVKIALENGKPLSEALADNGSAKLTSFETNADSQLSSSYEVFTLLNVDPSKDELDSSIYATIGYMGTGSSASVSYKNVGMWSYYPDRSNWNRE